MKEELNVRLVGFLMAFHDDLGEMEEKLTNSLQSILRESLDTSLDINLDNSITVKLKKKLL